LFLGIDGVYLFDGHGSPIKVSQRIEPDIKNINRDLWEYTCGTVWERKYIVSFARGA
jgi:hypothetical protein